MLVDAYLQHVGARPPVQLTQASSLWVQSICFRGTRQQSNRWCSLPVQFTSSSQMVPFPLPNLPCSPLHPQAPHSPAACRPPARPSCPRSRHTPSPTLPAGAPPPSPSSEWDPPPASALEHLEEERGTLTSLMFLTSKITVQKQLFKNN